MSESNNNYPVSLKVDYSEKSNRLTSFFRAFMVIPIGIILVLLNNGILFIPTLLMILFCKKYPKWWFDWNVSITKFSYRIFSYLILLRDEYPSTDKDQGVHIIINYPDVKNELKSGMPLVKWFLSIPHFFIIVFLYFALFICTIIAWFAILFTGTYPKGMFDFVVGVMRWTLRVSAYSFILTTDKYPPFSLYE